jgi:hypothetical protein
VACRYDLLVSAYPYLPGLLGWFLRWEARTCSVPQRRGHFFFCLWVIWNRSSWFSHKLDMLWSSICHRQVATVVIVLNTRAFYCANQGS